MKTEKFEYFFKFHLGNPLPKDPTPLSDFSLPFVVKLMAYVWKLRGMCERAAHAPKTNVSIINPQGCLFQILLGGTRALFGNQSCGHPWDLGLEDGEKFLDFSTSAIDPTGLRRRWQLP